MSNVLIDGLAGQKASALLNEGQAKALQAMTVWLADTLALRKELQAKKQTLPLAQRGFLLQGKPGTGKTFTMRAWLEQPNVRPLITATTNKAAKILSEASGMEAITIDKALGLRPGNTMSGGKRRKFRTGEASLLGTKYNCILLDEGSMADEDLMTHVLGLNHPVVVLADKWQLPPVTQGKHSKAQLSPIFDYGWTGVELTEVKRNGGEILAYTDLIREQVFAKSRKPPALKRFPGLVSDALSSQEAKALLQTPEILEGFKLGHAKYLAWTNQAVDTFNQFCRVLLQGEQALQYPILQGDLLVCTKPLMKKVKSPDGEEGDKDGAVVTLLTTDELVEVTKVLHAREEPQFFQNGYYCDEIQLVTEAGQPLVVYAPSLALGQHVLLRAKCEELVTQAKAAGAIGNKREAAALWEELELLPMLFLQAKSAYALTVHRSQGSTFQEVWVLRDNILRNPNMQEAFQCLNVAVSRASKRLRVISGT